MHLTSLLLHFCAGIQIVTVNKQVVHLWSCQQLLLLWDRIFAYDSMELLAGMATS